MSARRTSGLTEQDSFDAKVFLRSFNDALSCAQEIAEREAARAQYKEYVRALITATKFDQQIAIDQEGRVVAAKNAQVASVYEVIKFTQAIVTRYGLGKGRYDSYAELDQRLDRTITGL